MRGYSANSSPHPARFNIRKPPEPAHVAATIIAGGLRLSIVTWNCSFSVITVRVSSFFPRRWAASTNGNTLACSAHYTNTSNGAGCNCSASITVDRESLVQLGAHPADRVRRHLHYDHYLTDEVLPLMRRYNDNPYLIATGASFGGYHASNFAFRHPQLSIVFVQTALHDIKRFVHGWYDDNVYFNSPVDFVAGEHDGSRLDAMRRMDIILAVGRDDGLRSSNEYLAHVLWGKGIGNALRIWDGFAHDWPVWARMLPLYIGGHD